MNRSAAIIASSGFFLVAPGSLAGLIPFLVTYWRVGSAPWWVHLLGGILVVAGLAGLIECFARFIEKGLGTAAPLMPTQRLVTSGLYAYVRNPMYVSVLAIVLGQALLFANAALIAYTVTLFLGFMTFVVFFEERRLAYEFPDEWPAYSAAVPRWIPRLSPWRAPMDDAPPPPPA